MPEVRKGEKPLAVMVNFTKHWTLFLIGTILFFLIVQVYVTNYTNSNIEDTSPVYPANIVDSIPITLSPNNSLSCRIFENSNYLEQPSYFFVYNKKINPVDHQILIQPRNLCAESPFLMILVPSEHTHKDVRNAIRRTWGSEEWPCMNSKTSVKLMFLFGTYKHSEMEFIIKQEAEIFNDILQGDYVDSYYNLTIKVLGGLQWVSQNCDATSYVLKADEDTFTNVPLLIEFLKKHGIDRSVIGHLHTQSRVRRVGKWAVSKLMFPYHTYPNYMAGNTYLLSGDILDKVVRIAQYVPYLNIEDVFITGVLVRILKLRHMDVVGFTMWLSRTPSISEILRQEVITGHKITPSYSDEIWQAIQNNSSHYCTY